jgi:hypothetical protein
VAVSAVSVWPVSVWPASSLCLLLACGPGDGETAGDSTTATSDASTSTTATDTTPTTSATDAATTTDSDPTTSGTTSELTTGDDTTTGVATDFERFRTDFAAGPCGPEMDCDGFVELLGSGELMYEEFGQPGNPLMMAQLTPEDLDAAAAVFTDPALLALLDGSDPVCDPPTDIFEAMIVEVDGVTHKSGTTGCAQPPVAAAREMAQGLVEKYMP